MPIIDADAHVIENESAWDYMLESERQFRPRIVGAANGDPAVDYWFIDGRLMPRSNVEKTLPEAARNMSDLSIRIKHMDELNIDIQVIYPTIFIFPTARGRRPISPFVAATTAGWPTSSRKRRTVFAGWWFRRCSTWIGWRRN